MIKKYNQFVNESKEIPGPMLHGSTRINLDNDELELFSTEDELKDLISKQKISLLSPELWYLPGDTETINTLKNYFDVDYIEDDEVGDDYIHDDDDGFDEENESVKTNEKRGFDYDKHLDMYKNDPIYKKAADEAMIRMDKKDNPESYRDKMRGKVSDAKKRHEKK